MPGHRLELAWGTHQGRVRVRNEDAVLVREDLGLVVVADGVGGANAGHIASRLATEVIAEFLGSDFADCSSRETAELALETAVREANSRIRDVARAKRDCRGMGTTIVVGMAGPDWLAYGNVGDSRLYRWREGTFRQITRDHSFIQDIVDRGFFRSLSDAQQYGIGQNLLTHALGSGVDVRVSTGIEELQAGDIYLFCTDGLTNMIPDDWLRQVLAAIGAGLEPAVEALVQLACDRGGADNITLALLRVGEREGASCVAE